MKRPFLFFVLSFLFGIALSSGLIFPIPFEKTGILIAFSTVLLLFSFFVTGRKIFYCLVCAIFLLLGMVRYTDFARPSNNSIFEVIPAGRAKAVVYGVVVDEPQLKSSRFGSCEEFPLRVSNILIGGRERCVSGGMLVRRYVRSDRPRVGDVLLLEGRLSIPREAGNPHGFDHHAYLRNLGVHAVLVSGKGDRSMIAGRSGSPILYVKRVIYDARKLCGAAFDRYLYGDTRAIMKPLILGTRSDTGDKLNDLFIRTGTMHILAVSGLHVTFVAVTALGLFRIVNCPKRTAYFLTIVLICAYAVFTGAQPSAMRSALMGSFLLLFLAYGRRTALLDTLVLSAFLMTFFEPGQLFRPGFILSYAAVLSIIYVVPVTDTFFVPERNGHPVSPFSRITVYAAKSFSLSLGVWIGMMPVIAGYFRMITPSVILANLIAVPLFYLAMLFGFALLFFGPVYFLAPFSGLIARALDILVAFYVVFLEKIVAVPCAYVKVPSLPAPLFLTYYVVLSAIIFLSRKEPRRKGLIVIFMLFAAALFVCSEAVKVPQNNLRATFFHVGKADAAFVSTGEGGILVDGGSDGAGRNVIEPYLLEEGIRKIDCVILSHAHEDHVGGLSYIFKAFGIGVVIDRAPCPGQGRSVESYADFENEIKKEKIKKISVKQDDRVNGPGGTELIVLNPPDKKECDENSDSIVFKLVTQANRSILFCGDATARSMEKMLFLGSVLKSDIVKIPHHGSGLGDMNVVAEFLGHVRPGYAVITAKDRSEVNGALLGILARMGTEVFITGETGAVIAEESPEGWRVRGFRDSDNRSPKTENRRQNTEKKIQKK